MFGLGRAYYEMRKKNGDARTKEEIQKDTILDDSITEERAEELIKELEDEQDFAIMTEDGELVYITKEERIENVKKRIRI